MTRNRSNEPAGGSEAAGAIPVTDPRAQYLELRAETDRAVAEVLASGRYILGPSVSAFEEEVAGRLGLEAAFGCANGTDALVLCLMAAGVGEGDEVLVPAFTFVAPAEAIVLCGGSPRFVDVDPATFNVDPDGLRSSLSGRTKAAVVVHLFGQCAEMDPILEAAGATGTVVIEDAAQAFGALQGGRPAGGIGDLCGFSFYPTKNLGCMGDGGLVGTRDPRWVDALRFLRNHGEVEKYRHAMIGMNSRLDEVQAAVLRVRLAAVDRWNARRAEIAAAYDAAFSGLDLMTPHVAKGNVHVYHQYTVRTPRRDDLIVHLAARGISAAVHYPCPVHLQPAYARFSAGEGAFPVAERLAREVVSLPIYPHMDDAQVGRVIEGVRSFFGAA
jgi:dTDP-4-amino-4,6-dideoxygalactose transaminase